MNIREEDEITMGGLFDQYVWKGRTEAQAEEQKHIVVFCQEFDLDKEVSAEKLMEKLLLARMDADKSVELYCTGQTRPPCTLA